MLQPTVTVAGAGPAGLMAAEAAAGAGAAVTIVDQRRSFGRTLLLAGRSGLNLTHDEPLEVFLGRYGDVVDFDLMSSVCVFIRFDFYVSMRVLWVPEFSSFLIFTFFKCNVRKY